MKDYKHLTAHFETVMDFLRFAISESAHYELTFGHGSDNATDDMWHLILGCLNLPLDCQFALLNGRLTADEKNLLISAIEKRFQQLIPVPYITYQAYFCGLKFYVDERVLIPRSPIGELIQQQLSPWIELESVDNILDLCTGSGCIAIACQQAFPWADVVGVDISSDALAVAHINQKKLNFPEVQFIQSDCWEDVPQERYSVIISNPPYVGDEEMTTLPQEYDHEPELALRADNNGLSIVDKILAHASKYLTPEGILIVEVGNSEEAVIAAYPNLPFTWLEFEHGGKGVFLLTADQLKDYQ